MADALRFETTDPIREKREVGQFLERMFGTPQEPPRVGRYVLHERLGAGWAWST